MKEQFIRKEKNGDRFYYSAKEMEVLHREDGPAIEWANGDKEWWVNGERHREDGPAAEWSGNKEWWVNGKRHREDGPAVEHADGYKEWRVNGERHREDGPAIEHVDGDKEWYLNGSMLIRNKVDIRNKVKEYIS